MLINRIVVITQRELNIEHQMLYIIDELCLTYLVSIQFELYWVWPRPNYSGENFSKANIQNV